jgi:aminoglycoside/choline kinase family phosphotransferase
MNPDRRADNVAAFLERHKYASAPRQNFAADFSPRRYARLTQTDGKTVILMDADADQKTCEFVALATRLRQMDISVPEIYAVDIPNGLVLMEDFGSQNFGAMVDAGDDAKTYCRWAATVLSRIHGVYDHGLTDIQLPVFDAALFVQQVEHYIDEYIPYVMGRGATATERADFIAAWQRIFAAMPPQPQTLMLRDYMLDNLMYLPERPGWRSVGVLDFQDAGLGPMTYDLASLCEQVRRDLGEDAINDVVAYYVGQTKTALSTADWLHACHIFAAQRHMRILGRIAHLVVKAGRPEKLAYLPRVKKYLDFLLQDPALKPVLQWLEETGIS